MPDQRPPSGDPSDTGDGVEDLAGRLEALGADVRRAKADALTRQQASEPGSRRRRLVFAGGLAGAVALAGVTAGLALADTGTSGSGRAPVEVYLADHVTSGTSIGVIGATAGSALPSGYQRVELAVANLSQAAGLHYAVGPDPITAAGPLVAAFVGGHATLVATDPGRATLWEIHSAGASGTSTATTVGGSAATSSTGPATTGPATTGPATTGPATTAPVTAAPATTVPPAATTAPATSVPATTVPATTVPATTVPATTAPSPAATGPAGPSGGAAPAAASTTSWVVRPGDSFWSIALAVQQARSGATPTAAQVAGYWSRLVTANLDRLPVRGDTNVIYPGQTLALPG